MIKTGCTACKEDVTLTPLSISLCIPNVPAVTPSYRFTCPLCDALVTIAATPALVSLLERVGARVVNVKVPAEVAEIVSITLPAMSHDDALDLHIALAERDDLVALIVQTP